MDQPYYLGFAFLALALISLFFVRSVWVEQPKIKNVRFLERTFLTDEEQPSRFC